MLQPVCVPRHVQLFATPWTVTCRAPLSVGFSKEEYTGAGGIAMFSSSRSSWPRDKNCMSWVLQQKVQEPVNGFLAFSLGAGVSWLLPWVETGSGSSGWCSRGVLSGLPISLVVCLQKSCTGTVLLLPAPQRLQLWFWSCCFLFIICPQLCMWALIINPSWFLCICCSRRRYKV